MKKLILPVAVAAAFSLVACGDDKPPTVAHETRVGHHHHSSDPANAASDDNPDHFQAVERPSTYSR